MTSAFPNEPPISSDESLISTPVITPRTPPDLDFEFNLADCGGGEGSASGSSSSDPFDSTSLKRHDVPRYSNQRPTICASALKAFAKRSRVRAEAAGEVRGLCISRPQKSIKKQHICDVSIQRLPVQGFSENQRVLVLSSGNAYMLGRTLFESSGNQRVVMHATLLRRVSGRTELSVRLMQHATDQQYAATQHERVVKILSVAEDLRDDPRQEIALQQSLDCDNLCKLSEVASDKDSFYLIMPFFNGGELYSRVEKVGSLPEDRCKSHMCDILRGVQHMHENKIAHLDLSLENIMLSSSNFRETSHIIDFGLAREVEDELNTVSVQRVAGKLAYMSPEIYENAGKFDGFKADVWACGVMLFVMLIGKQPYAKASIVDDPNFATLISKGPSALLDSWGLASEVSPGARSLLDSMLAAAPASRPSVASILEQDGWFRA